MYLVNLEGELEQSTTMIPTDYLSLHHSHDGNIFSDYRGRFGSHKSSEWKHANHNFCVASVE